jgi:hypothetical protein
MNVKDFQELKALAKPPAGVDDVVGVAGCLIMGKPLQQMATAKRQKGTWAICQQIMSNPNRFLLQIKAFDAEAAIPNSTLREIRATTRKDHFNFEEMKKKSSAAAALADWALKTLEYNELYQKVSLLMQGGVSEGPVDSAVHLSTCVPIAGATGGSINRGSKGKIQASLKEAAEIKAVADGELAEFDMEATKEAMEAAKEAANCLTKGAIQELKSLGKPPVECMDVCAACAFLLKGQRKKLDWKGAQKMMNNPGQFLEEIMAFDAKNIPDDSLKNCQPLIDQPFFNFQVMKGKSTAAAYLTNWVVNIVSYNRIYKKVAPLMEKEGIATETKEKAEGSLKESMKIADVMNADRNAYLAKSDIVELKSLCKPPVGVISVLRCVQILLGKDEDWAAGKRMLGDVSFMRTLMEYRRDDATQDQLQRVQLLLESDAALRDDTLSKVSKAAYGLLRWVRAVVLPEMVGGVSMCPTELEIDGELRTAATSPVTTPASTQGSASNLSTPSAIAEKSGMIHPFPSEETAKGPKLDTKSTNDTDKKCVIS